MGETKSDEIVKYVITFILINFSKKSILKAITKLFSKFNSFQNNSIFQNSMQVIIIAFVFHNLSLLSLFILSILWILKESHSIENTNVENTNVENTNVERHVGEIN